MDRLEFWRCQESVFVSLVDFEFIGEIQFFQEPENPLRPGVFKVVNDDHGLPFRA
jgi:hypothetical protein